MIVKKQITFIIALWLLGIAGYTWVSLDRHIEKKRLSEHEQLIKAKVNNLDKVITGQADLSLIPETFADDTWQTDIERFQKRNSVRPLVKSSSTGSIALGFLIIISLWLIQIFKSNELFGFSSESANFPAQSGGVINQPSQLRERSSAQITESASKPKGIPKIKNEPVTDILSNRSPYDFGNINTMFCDEKTANRTACNNNSSDNNTDKPFEQITIQQNPSINDRSLKAHTESLEKQVTELKEMAESVRQAAVEKPASEDSVLSDLTEQISAIRQFASQQQNRNEKLQEGYDWNIIKNFCLRIIRSIDNIQARIDKLAQDNIDTADLEDIRDELIFSLESSGVEQFAPEINSKYCGQEKFAEVLKEKVTSTEGQKGKIAEVIKPGYQYMIDDDNVRVVRTARVKLFQ